MRGSCHCGSIKIEVPLPPEWVADCNCSLCTKRGTLTAYYPTGTIQIEGETATYIWGGRMIAQHFCPTCGCAVHWTGIDEDFGKEGVNARLLDDFDLAAVEIRKLDNR